MFSFLDGWIEGSQATVIDSPQPTRYHRYLYSTQRLTMKDPRQTTIDARPVALDRNSKDVDAALDSGERVFEALAQIAQGDLSVLANGKNLDLSGRDRQLLTN